jgi:hypothetical protein
LASFQPPGFKSCASAIGSIYKVSNLLIEFSEA